ncbi:NAD(P)-dependent oxidoreductase, partial [Streptomyces sp. NPDC091280]|uniref:NAD(P)-dependent oxidoreductase n=1 Tax=Streptomyces sp. NPDC091280 TaxID=3365984 RepID=UPI003802010C
MKIGFIGWGRMGRPIVDRLTAAGHDVTVHARRAETRAAVRAAGLTAAGTVRATVRDADAVFVVVLTDEQVRAVCLGTDGALAAMRPGATLVQHTTSSPATAHLLTGAGAERGVGVLDAALSGGPHDIAAGRLTLWVGGDESRLEETRPLLETYAAPVVFVGPAGNGQRVKLVNNALFVAQVGLAVDAVRVAGSLGIDEKVLLAALQHGSGASRALDVVARGGSVEAVAERLADLMRKDVDVVREVARSAGADLGIIGTVLSSDAVEEKVLRSRRAGAGGRAGGGPAGPRRGAAPP